VVSLVPKAKPWPPGVHLPPKQPEPPPGPHEYVSCPRCHGTGKVPLASLSRYDDAGRVRAELWRRLAERGQGTTAKSRREWTPLYWHKLGKVQFGILTSLLAEDPELTAAVTRLTGVTVPAWAAHGVLVGNLAAAS